MGSLPATSRRWLEHKAESGCSRGTLARYRWGVERATRVLREAGRPVDPARWGPADAHWLRRRFHDEVWELRLLSDLARSCGNSVFRTVGVPRRQGRPRVRSLRAAQAEAILRAVRDDPPLRLVVLLGFVQGFRRGDWVRLRLADLDLASPAIRRPPGESGQPPGRWRPLHPMVGEALRDFLWFRHRKIRRFRWRNPGTSVPEELFLHVRQGRLAPYRPHGARKWMDEIARRLPAEDPPLRLSSDMLRRWGAQRLAESLPDPATGAPPEDLQRTVQSFLGHRTARATQAYLRANAEGGLS